MTSLIDASLLPPGATEDDRRFMQAALAYGRRHLGQTAPNPSVGALVVRDGVIVGRGATRPGGRPHAETVAIADAGELARGATLYVTLEPCSHHGRTPPCADAIVRAGLARVVSAIDDPDPRVSGQGHARIRAAGIELVTHVCAAEARRANLGHITRTREGRPMVTLKLAETADGYAAGSDHDPRLTITGLAANQRVQMMRAAHDAIMIGIGTAKADDPLLTVRLPGLDAIRPLRIVLDAKLELPLRSRLVTTARDVPLLVLCAADAPAEREAALSEAGATVARLEAPGPRIDLKQALQRLGSLGLTRIFSEGGPRIGAELIRQGLADDVVIFTSPRPLGREGAPALAPDARAMLFEPGRYDLLGESRVGNDRMREYERI